MKEIFNTNFKINKHIAIVLSVVLMVTLIAGSMLISNSLNEIEEAYAASAIASVTSGDTTTIYASLNDAVNAWVDGSTLTLLSDVTITSKIQKSNIPSLTLDLNGKTITLNSSANEQRVIQINGLGSVLNIIDSSGTNAGRLTGINPGASDDGWSGAIYINSGAIVNMYGGTISGNASTNGAGVWIDGRGHVGQAQFNMYGGLITGNTATNGGGVYVGCWLYNEPTTAYFNMYGGTITDNTATNGSNVYIDRGIMTMIGGTINGGVEHSNASDDYAVIAFDANGGTGTMSAQYVLINTDTIIKDNEYYNLEAIKSVGYTREGYTFKGWNTQADGLGDKYTPGESNINISENIILYAQWEEIPPEPGPEPGPEPTPTPEPTPESKRVDENSGVSVETSDGTAIPQDITLKVVVKAEVTKVEGKVDPALIQAKLKDKEVIAKVYDVKLIQTTGGIAKEIQPSEIKEGMTIKVQFELPKDVKTKGLRVLHVHNDGTIDEINNVALNGRVALVEVASFSQFVLVTPVSHGFCVGWVVFIFAMLEMLCACIYVILRFGLIKEIVAKCKLDSLYDKMDLLTLIGLCVSVAIFLFALIALCLHQCAISIISFILAAIICGGFSCFFVQDKGIIKELKKELQQSIEDKADDKEVEEPKSE